MNNNVPVPTIETPRLILTIPTATDAPRLCDYVTENRAHLSPWEPRRTASYYTLAFWQTELLTPVTEFQNDQSLRLIISARNEPQGSILGIINYRNFIRGVFQSCTLGYSIDHQFQGQGVMFEALEASLKYVFDTLNLHRVMANYIPTNTRSGNLLKRLGFESEGTARAYLYIAGEWQDHILTAKINPAWKEIQ